MLNPRQFDQIATAITSLTQYRVNSKLNCSTLQVLRLLATYVEGHTIVHTGVDDSFTWSHKVKNLSDEDMAAIDDEEEII